MTKLNAPTNDPEILDKIARLYRQGKKDREIAAELGLTVRIVGLCRAKRGLRKNRR